MHDSWPRENFLRVRSLRTARSIHTQLHGEMAKNHIPVTSCGNDSALVSRAVCAGFFANSARRIGNESAYKLLPRPSESGAIANGGLSQLIYPHPTSVFAQLNQAPPFVVFHQIVATARPFMRHILAVDHSVLVKARSPLETMITTQVIIFSSNFGSADRSSNHSPLVLRRFSSGALWFRTAHHSGIGRGN